VPADLALVRLPLRLVQQLGRHQQVQQLQRVIDGLGLQVPGGGQQRREPPVIGVAADQPGVGGHPVAGQLGEPPRRHHRLGAQPGEAESLDLRDLVQRGDDRRAAAARRRALAPPLQVRYSHSRRDLRQPVQHPPLGGGQQRLQHPPQAVRRLIADPRDQPRQRGHARQQHLPLPQPGQRVGVDRLRPVPGRPRPRGHPPGKLRLGFGEVPQPVPAPDLLLVVGLRLHPLGVPLHHRGVLDAELPAHEVQHLTRHVERVLQERPEPPHRHQLQSEPGLHVAAAPQADQLQVLVIEEEHPLKVRLRRRGRVPPVRRRLIIRQELNRHNPYRRREPGSSHPQQPNRNKIMRCPADPHRNGCGR
jgi:hypothetical protein